MPNTLVHDRFFNTLVFRVGRGTLSPQISGRFILYTSELHQVLPFQLVEWYGILLTVEISADLEAGHQFSHFEMVSFQEIRLDPPPATAPNCRVCNRRTTRLITRVSNRKGNANRPYYKCIQCDKFQRFDDDRGNDPRNPLCLCQTPSKQQVAGPDKLVPRGLHYVCRSGACDFYGVRRDAQERQITLDEDLVETLASLRLI